MRPIRRGTSPQTTDFSDYTKAKPELVSRLGRYCSYCERPLSTHIAVEHIQPKNGNYAFPHLVGTWTNFLLACVNCNSAKSDKKVVLADVFLPDRDNTFYTFSYPQDGTVIPSAAIKTNPYFYTIAKKTLELTGLDKKIIATTDANGKQIALDRVSQRLETWGIALEAQRDINLEPYNQALRRSTVHLALATGFFSIWMTVFIHDTDMRNRLIDAFPGTRASGCFDPMTTTPITPAPNPDNLMDGGKL